MPESNQKSNRSILLKYAVNILNRRPYFRHALKIKLELKSQKENLSNYKDDIEKILSELSDGGYLNDLYLAEAFVRRQLSKHYGPKIISLKLKQLNLDSKTINLALFSEAEKEKQVVAVQKFATKNSHQDIRKVINKLYQRGFSSEIINTLQHSSWD